MSDQTGGSHLQPRDGSYDGPEQGSHRRRPCGDEGVPAPDQNEQRSDGEGGRGTHGGRHAAPSPSDDWRRSGRSGLPAEHVLQPDPRDDVDRHGVADQLKELADDEHDDESAMVDTKPADPLEAGPSIGGTDEHA